MKCRPLVSYQFIVDNFGEEFQRKDSFQYPLEGYAKETKGNQNE